MYSFPATMTDFNATNTNGTAWVGVAVDIFQVRVFLSQNSHFLLSVAGLPSPGCCHGEGDRILSAELWCNYKSLSLASHIMFS